MTIMAYKLITGEDVFAEESVKTDTVQWLKNPVAVGSYVHPQSGEQKIGLAPFPNFAEVWRKGQPDRSMSIRLEHIVYSYELIGNLAHEYEQIFNAGIIKPVEKKIILG